MAAREPPRHGHGAARLSCPTPATTTSNLCSFLNGAVSAWLVCTVLSLFLFNLLWFYPVDAPSNAAALRSVTSGEGKHPSMAGGTEARCDYSQGRWVAAAGRARRYNGTACNVKESERCIGNGRPDTGYLDWRWQPASCELPAFDAAAFVAVARGKHVAFVGDSMARNQAESLVCLLATAFPYNLVYHDPNQEGSQVLALSIPAPFLAKSTGKMDDYRKPRNLVYLDALAERWSADADTMDVVVISQGHWFWIPTIYHNATGEVVGMHNVTGLKNTDDIGLFTPYRRTLRMTLERLVGSGAGNRTRTVVVATFSPSHFEKAWDDPTTCARTRPYEEGEKEVGGNERELRSIAMEEVAAAAARRGGAGASRVEVLDVTKLATMRPDGHPGVYMHLNPFSRGVPKRLQVDCLHFCLPGPVDTFNEILLQLLINKGRPRETNETYQNSEHRTPWQHRHPLILTDSAVQIAAVVAAPAAMGAYGEPPLRHHHGGKPPSSSQTRAGDGVVQPIRDIFLSLIYAVLCLALLYLLCFTPRGSPENAVSTLLRHITIASGEGRGGGGGGCDYSEGRWVAAAGHARRYNGTACDVKGSEDCARNGRPDTGYLDWRWQPASCELPAFDVAAFLAAVRSRHVAFVGDSMARNQAESLVCLLGSAFPYRLVYRDPEPGTRKFWRWAFPTHGVTVSVYWAPFLAMAAGRPENFSVQHNLVYLDTLAERWAADADTMDVAVISTGHWFWNPTVYYHNGGEVLGVHNFPELNHTEIGFFSPYREAIRMSLERLLGSAAGRTVVVTTFSPAHFEKEWDDPTTCARTRPYEDGEKEVGGIEGELRSIAMEEAASAAATARSRGGESRVEVLDVTKLATMRPDGHPGVYMHRDPFARGVPERLQSDCLHFCLPGPVDTFNEILLQLLIKKKHTTRYSYTTNPKPSLLPKLVSALEMGAYQPLQQQHHHGAAAAGYFLPRTVVTWLAAACLSLALLHLLCCSPPGAHQAVFSPLLQFFNGTYSNISSSSSGVAGGGGGGGGVEEIRSTSYCDYSVGRWVRAPGHARRYNGTACNVKPEQDCIRNGRPETGYLDWRWQPASCELPAFDAAAFLAAARGKHVAFVGDSMARNQAESLLCLLGAAFPYDLVDQDAEHYKRQFTRWSFPSHGVTLSTYWAPFLVRSGGKPFNYTMPYNLVYLDELGNRWDADAGTMDVVVLTAGHWFWNPAVYHRRGEVVGVHAHPELNATEIGFTSPYREAFRRALERLGSDGRRRTVVLGTFAPPHFEGKPIFDPTACTRTEPYKDGEKEVGSIEREMRSIVFEEAAAAAAATTTMRVEVEDVTRLATMRPDGHPGVYMHRDPFAGGVPERMQTDCLHSCLPGPVDTFNEILLQILSRPRDDWDDMGAKLFGSNATTVMGSGCGTATMAATAAAPRGTTANMKMAYKCVVNGKTDGGYLHWRWQPAGCNLSALDPAAFLGLLRGKRLAFVGDSTARNQAEALVCHLATVARPVTVWRDEEGLGRKFWRWAFPAPHDVNVSTYWSPFLVRSEGHSEDYGMAHEVVILDVLTDPWAADLDAMDVMVISAGHWFPHSTIYYDDGEIVGVHDRPDMNRTEMSAPSVYRKVLRRTLEHVNAMSSAYKLVVVEIIAPAHFDGRYSWNHRDACSRQRPYDDNIDGEAKVGDTEADLRKAVLEEAAPSGDTVLDVTRLAAMRQDAHPGVYIYGERLPALVRAGAGRHVQRHPDADDRRRRLKLANRRAAVELDTAQWKETILVITYDKHDSFYDHVQTPMDMPIPDIIINTSHTRHKV
uniref:Trichome birefringence-like N-terminal domain-containing protein n=1 Tax=Oryza punctata TaxID=4537 RepID=A0A0E0L9R6_ORYPU